MATAKQIRTGRCPTHGTVQATREVPETHFPYIIYGIRRLIATRRPFRCPTCGTPAATS